MFESFSESSRRVTMVARYEAGRLKSDTIDLQHLLLAFIVEDQGDMGLHLQKIFGFDEPPLENPARLAPRKSFLDRATATKLQAAFSVFGERPEPQPMHGDMPLAKAVKMAFSRL